MTHQPHLFSNLFLAGQYFEKLPADDISRRYFAGEQYSTSWANRVKMLFATDSVLTELHRFYPHQPIVKRTYEVYQEKAENYKRNAFLFSAFSIFTVFQLAKHDVVLPVLSRFGKFFKTHRLLRQYVWLAILPYTFATLYPNYFFLNQTERLWNVHAIRLNQKKLEDPEDSQYPVELLPLSQVHSWQTPRIHKYDRKQKWDNEVPIFFAPDYANVEEWEKVPISDEDTGEGAAEGEAGEAGESAEE